MDQDLFDFLTENKLSLNDVDVPRFLRCSKCLKIMVKSVVTQCGCGFCESCLNELVVGREDAANSGSLCPGPCTGENAELVVPMLPVIPDVKSCKEIQRLRLRCPVDECNDVVCLQKMLEHVQDCVKRQASIRPCLYRKMGCSATMFQGDVKHHMEDDRQLHDMMMLDSVVRLQLENGKLMEELRKNRVRISMLEGDREVESGRIRSHRSRNRTKKHSINDENINQPAKKRKVVDLSGGSEIIDLDSMECESPTMELVPELCSVESQAVRVGNLDRIQQHEHRITPVCSISGHKFWYRLYKERSQQQRLIVQLELLRTMQLGDDEPAVWPLCVQLRLSVLNAELSASAAGSDVIRRSIVLVMRPQPTSESVTVANHNIALLQSNRQPLRSIILSMELVPDNRFEWRLDDLLGARHKAWNKLERWSPAFLLKGFPVFLKIVRNPDRNSFNVQLMLKKMNFGDGVMWPLKLSVRLSVWLPDNGECCFVNSGDIEAVCEQCPDDSIVLGQISDIEFPVKQEGTKKQKTLLIVSEFLSPE